MANYPSRAIAIDSIGGKLAEWQVSTNPRVVAAMEKVNAANRMTGDEAHSIADLLDAALSAMSERVIDSASKLIIPVR